MKPIQKNEITLNDFASQTHNLSQEELCQINGGGVREWVRDIVHSMKCGCGPNNYTPTIEELSTFTLF